MRYKDGISILFSLIGNFSCLRVVMIFNRDSAFYFTTVFIPDIILVTSSFITFWLEWNAVPARVMLGVTTMLNFFTTRYVLRTIWDVGLLLTLGLFCTFQQWISIHPSRRIKPNSYEYLGWIFNVLYLCFTPGICVC